MEREKANNDIGQRESPPELGSTVTTHPTHTYYIEGECTHIERSGFDLSLVSRSQTLTRSYPRLICHCIA